MSIVRAFSSGIRRATAEPKMVLVLYFTNLLIALPVAMAFRAVLQAGFGSSMAPSSLMEGLDFTTWSDFVTAHGDELSAVFRQISWVVIVSMLLNSFLSGGILTILKDSRGKYSASSFFGGCGAYLGRFLRLFVLFVIVLLLVSLLVGTLVALLADGILENASSEVTDFWVRIATIVLFFIPAMIVMMIADYAKVSVVLNEEQSMLKSAWKSTRFVFRHFFRTFGLELLLVLVPVLLFALYALVDLYVGASSDFTIVFMMVVQQLFVASRAWTKVMFFEGELSLYESLQPVVYSSVETSGGSIVTEPARP
jgi:hypothetical protein